jgi:hypothetical protein
VHRSLLGGPSNRKARSSHSFTTGEKMKIKIAIAVLILAIAVIPTQANPNTGDLKRVCQTFLDVGLHAKTVHESFNVGICIGMINGYSSGTSGMAAVDGTDESYLITYKPGVDVEQLIKVFVSYIKAHPEEEEKPIETTLIKAFVAGHVVTITKIQAVPKASEN